MSVLTAVYLTGVVEGFAFGLLTAGAYASVRRMLARWRR